MLTGSGGIVTVCQDVASRNLNGTIPWQRHSIVLRMQADAITKNDML